MEVTFLNYIPFCFIDCMPDAQRCSEKCDAIIDSGKAY